MRKTHLTQETHQKEQISSLHVTPSSQGQQLHGRVLPTDLKADPESVHLKNNVVPKNTTTLYLIQTHYSDWTFKDIWHTPNMHTKYLQTQMHTHADNQSSRDKRGYTNAYIQIQTYKCINTNTQGPCTITHLCAYLCMCLFFMHFSICMY